MIPLFHRQHFVKLARIANRKAIQQKMRGHIATAFALFVERDMQMARAGSRRQKALARS